MSLILEHHSYLNTTQIGMLLKLNVTQIKISLNWQSHSNWKVTQIGMLLKMECHSNWNVTQIEM